MGFRRADDVNFEVVDGRAILLDASGAELITLNPVGTLVWEALDRWDDVDALTDGLLPEFDDVPRERLHADIASFLDELREIGLVTEQPAG